jgi:peroxiredoxin
MSTAPWPYPAPADDGGAAHLVEGLPLPDVSLPATMGGGVNVARLAGTSLLFVYPWTGRPGLSNPPNWDDISGAHGSTPEAEGFRDHYDAFRAMGFEVLGLSGQDTEHQREFAKRIGLPFPLLSDAEGKLAGALRLPSFETGGVTYLKRLTLVVSGGKIARVFYPVHPPHTHASEVLSSLRQGR